MNSKEKNFEAISKEIKAAVMVGPSFAQNSKFQTDHFVIDAETGDARRYRQILLELNQKRLALAKAEIRRAKSNAKLASLRKALDDAKFANKDEFEQTGIECDIQDMELDLDNEEKLILDAAEDFRHLYNLFKSSKKFSGAEYEKNELEYWKHRLIKEAQRQVSERGAIESGTAKSMHQIGLDPIQCQIELRDANQNIILKITENLKKLIAVK